MDEAGGMLVEMTDRLFGRLLDDSAVRSIRSGIWPTTIWKAVLDQGLPLALVEGEQGFGVPLSDGLQLLRLLGRHALALPLAETMVGNALLARAGLPVVNGVLVLVPEGSGVTFDAGPGRGWRAHGKAARIAWGRKAEALLVEDRGRLSLIQSGFQAVEHGENLASMPRDTVQVDAVTETASSALVPVLHAGSLARALAMAGALEMILSMTIEHVTQRVQFGRTLSSFQAVQHLLARLGAEVCAASASADLAADAFANSSPHLDTAIAAARSRISDATGVAVGIAHQLHGAIGFTAEHRLHWFTTALWSWRDEFGAASWWTSRLGATVLKESKQGYWPFVTSV